MKTEVKDKMIELIQRELVLNPDARFNAGCYNHDGWLQKGTPATCTCGPGESNISIRAICWNLEIRQFCCWPAIRGSHQRD